MPCGTSRAGKFAHGSEDGEDLLRVVQHVVGFLPHLHHDADDVVTGRGKPAVTLVELVAEDKAKRGFHWPQVRFKEQSRLDSSVAARG